MTGLITPFLDGFLTFGLGSGSVLVLPANLAAAIKAEFLASSEASADAPGGIFNGMAKDGADPSSPYVVFKIASDPTEYLSNSSRWGVTRIKFDAIASTAEAANVAARAIIDLFGGYSGIDGIRLDFEDGFTTAFVLDDRSQGASPTRGKGNQRIFKSYVCYSTKVRQGNL